MQIACETIRALLAPDVCAVVLRIAPDEAPVAAGWPDAAQGEALVARAAVAAGLPVPATVTLWPGPRPASEGPLAWVTSARNAGMAGLALAWHGTAPEAAQRVLAISLYASLVSAAASITAQQRHEEERLRSVVNALPHGVALLSPAGRVRLANPAARVLLEALEAWPADTEPLVRIGAACLRPMLDEAQQGRAAQGEILLPTTGRTIALHVVPAADAGLALGGAGRDVVLILDDVTDARRSTAQLARAEKLSALGVLIYGIVHEINNPLATILGYAQMLAGTPPAEQHERWIRTLEEDVPTPTADKPYGLTLAQINVRSGPASSFPSYGLIEAKERVNLLGQTLNGLWYQIEYPAVPAGVAWVSSQYVKVKWISGTRHTLIMTAVRFPSRDMPVNRYCS